MIAELKPISILPIDSIDDDSAFREVIAYLKGVADTVAAQTGASRPLSLIPVSQRTSSLRAGSPPSSLVPPLGQPSSQPAARVPLFSLAPALGLIPTLVPSGIACPRITLRFGELSFERPSAWPQVAVGATWEPTRGGARLLDPGSVHPMRESDGASLWRQTLPYGAPSVSLASLSLASSGPAAPYSPSYFPWADGERSSEVRLRTAELPREYYELTGTESSA
jgi:hypothetical protein